MSTAYHAAAAFILLALIVVIWVQGNEIIRLRDLIDPFDRDGDGKPGGSKRRGF